MPFLPLTATPFPRPGYREMLPCTALAPYVRCFWTSWNERGPAGREAEAGDSAIASGRDAIAEAASVIIPDVCADIIIETDGCAGSPDDREITGMGFCGVNDRMFRSGHSPDAYKRFFGIRFYVWQASRFSDEPLSGTANGFFDLNSHFAAAGKMLREQFSPRMGLADFAHAAEGILLSLLARPVQKVPAQNHLVLDAVMQMIRARGSQNLYSLQKDIHASERQLERLFAGTLSLSPKKLSSLVRYQSLWQDVCRNGAFDVQNAVFAYGYFDQAHLLNDFKKFHGMSLRDARRTAGLSAFYNTWV
ncbi:MAG: helix-turn-helix domain-containing protein [Treponema sp.]|nr:helix-turn-helix domain-containing protein [Treponema sp.]